MPLSIYQINGHKLGSWPVEQSLFSIEPAELILSGLKKAEDRESYIIRVYNPTDQKIKGQIRFNAKIDKAIICSLNEQRLEQLKINSGNEIEISVEKGKIKTIELEQLLGKDTE